MRSSSRLVAFSVSLLVSLPTLAQDLQTEGVVYSFMQMRIGSAQQWGLLPRAADTVRPDGPLTASIPNAFQVLRSNKVATYGNSSIQVGDANLQQGVVVVQVDPASAGYLEVIAAETVYTFTQLGIERVVFPGYHDEGLTRADIPYASFQFEVPLWQAFNAGALPATDVILPNGERRTSAAVSEGLAAGDPVLQQALLSYLALSAPTPKFAILAALPESGIPAYERAVLPLLQDPQPYLRDAAVRSLANTTDPEALEALVTLLAQDPEPGIRALVAETLAQARVESYRFYEVAYRLQGSDPAVRGTALSELGASPDPRAADLLASALLDAEVAFALAAADALAQRGDWTRLVASLSNDAISMDVRQAAASSLAQGASGEARLRALHFRAMNSTGSTAVGAAEAVLAESGPLAREIGESLLTHPDRALRVYVADSLGQRGDADSLGALEAAHAQSGEDLVFRASLEEAAVGILQSGGTQVAERAAAAGSSFQRAAAMRALGQLAAAGGASGPVFDRLRDGLSDPDPAIRGASAIGLGQFASRPALDAILVLSEDPDPYVQGAVALALGSFPGEDFAETVNPLVIQYVQSGEPIIMAGALDALARLGHSQLRGFVMERITFPDASVRAAAMRATARLADVDSPRDAINALGGALRDAELDNRLLAIRLLGDFSNDASVILISQLVNESTVEIRFAAIDALARTRRPSAGSVLVSLLEDPSREIKRACIEGFRTIRLRQLAPDLNAAAGRESDATIAQLLRETAEWLQTHGE